MLVCLCNLISANNSVLSGLRELAPPPTLLFQEEALSIWLVKALSIWLVKTKRFLSGWEVKWFFGGLWCCGCLERKFWYFPEEVMMSWEKSVHVYPVWEMIHILKSSLRQCVGDRRLLKQKPGVVYILRPSLSKDPMTSWILQVQLALLLSSHHMCLAHGRLLFSHPARCPHPVQMLPSCEVSWIYFPAWKHPLEMWAPLRGLNLFLSLVINITCPAWRHPHLNVPSWGL